MNQNYEKFYLIGFVLIGLSVICNTIGSLANIRILSYISLAPCIIGITLSLIYLINHLRSKRERKNNDETESS